MKLNQLLTENNLTDVYLKGVKRTGALKSFKGNFALSRGREEEIITETVRLIKGGLLTNKAIWNYFSMAKDALKMQGDVNSIENATSAIKRLAGEHAPASTEALHAAAVQLQVLVEENNTLFGGIYKCKQVLDELAGLALKRYVRNNNDRVVDEEISFFATMTLKGLGVWSEYQKALDNGGTL